MLTIERFAALADAYGADLRRWPEDLRGEAEELLGLSPEARVLFDDAQQLDEAIAAARNQEDALFSQLGGPDAALARLRSGVGARVASSERRRSAYPVFEWLSAERFNWIHAWRLRWIGMTAGGALAIAAGLLIGVTYESAPAPDLVLAMLQPAPLHILAY